MLHPRGYQRERGPGYKRNSGERRRLPVIVIAIAMPTRKKFW